MRIATTLLLLLLGITSFGQQPSAKEELYKIVSTHNISHPDYIHTSKRNFENFVSTHSTSPYRLIGKYWLAHIFSKLNNVDSARLLYTQVLEISVPDSIDDALYQHNSAKQLAYFYINEKDYCSALNYIDLAKVKFIPIPMCGNALAGFEMEMKVLYSSCYVGQGDHKKAIDTLAPFMFANGFADNTKLVEKLYDTYLKVHSKEEIKNEFLQAEKSLVIKKEQYYSHSFLQPAIKIFDKEIQLEVYNYDLNKLTEAEQKQKCLESIKKSVIYKLAAR